MSNSASESPFEIPKEVEVRLNCNEPFRTLRHHLEKKENDRNILSYCQFHQQACSQEEQSIFRLHRDITHAVLLPLFEIHAEASAVASYVLPSKNWAEPERAFRGEARGAYSWLHCILTEERDWCMAEGCPACVVLHVLYSEPTIRVVTVACRLSDRLAAKELTEFDNGLPTFDFWLQALETAVRRDPLWGDAFWPDIEYRAYGLEMGIKQLIMQCSELRNGRKMEDLRSKSCVALSTPANRYVCRYQMRMIPIQPSNFARVQLKMLWENRSLYRNALLHLGPPYVGVREMF